MSFWNPWSPEGIRLRFTIALTALAVGLIVVILFLAAIGFNSLVGGRYEEQRPTDFIAGLRWQHNVIIADLHFRPKILPEKTPIKLLKVTIDGVACDQPIAGFSKGQSVAIPFHNLKKPNARDLTMNIQYQIVGTDAIGDEELTVYLPEQS